MTGRRPDPDEHARQLQGIANRTPAHTVADLLPDDADENTDLYAAAVVLEDMAVVSGYTFVDTDDTTLLEIHTPADVIPTVLLDVFVSFGLSIDPERTQSRPGETVVVVA